MKKISIVLIVFIMMLIGNVYAEELINLNIVTDTLCNVSINISNNSTTDQLIAQIKSKYQGFEISSVNFNSSSLASGQSLYSQGITNGSTINVVSNVTHRYEDKGVTKMPTCTETGVRTSTCSTCGNENNTQIAPLGHALDNKSIIQSTCTRDGANVHACIRCNYAEKTPILRTGHVYTVWAISKEPTCIEEGQMTRKCVKCGRQESAVVDKIAHDIIEEKIEPTCNKVGYIMHKCSTDCGYIENKTQIFAKGHNLTEWVVSKEPTLVDKGEKTRKCKNENCIYEEKEEISSLATGGNQTEVVDGIVEELKKEENRGKLFIIIGIIILPVVYVILRDIYITEKNNIKKKKEKKKTDD